MEWHTSTVGRSRYASWWLAATSAGPGYRSLAESAAAGNEFLEWAATFVEPLAAIGPTAGAADDWKLQDDLKQHPQLQDLYDHRDHPSLRAVSTGCKRHSGGSAHRP